MADKQPKSDHVAATWLEFEQKILATMGEMPTEVRALVKAGFCFGHIAMLGMMESILEQTKDPEAIELTLAGFRNEIDETMERSSVKPN